MGLPVHRAANLEEMPGIAHGFFSSQGGVSEGIYASLNCGPGSKDDPALVAENRALVTAALVPQGRLITLAQIHSPTIHVVGPDWSSPAEGDGMVTATPGLILGIQTADCAPVLLADAKALHVAREEPEAVIIGCDQLLVCDGRWFDKPTDLDEARAHLQALRGRTHTLVTAVLCRHGKKLLWQTVAKPGLTMRNFSDAFLETYLSFEAASLTSTVGAYRLEGLGVHLFASIEGEHAAILGLPLLDLLGFLRQHGMLAS